MLNLANAEWLFSLIILVIAYYISITINGIFQTRLASKFGDTLAQDLGYYSFNPLNYFDPFAFIFLIFFHLGLPYTIPINPFNLNEPNRMVKLLFIYLSESIISIVIAFISLFISILLYGGSIINKLAFIMFVLRIAPLKEATIYFPEYSSLSIVFALLFVSFVFLNIFIAVYSLIFNGIKYILILGFERSYSYMEYADYLFLFGSMVLIFFFANPLRCLLLELIMWLANNIVALTGTMI